MNKQLAEYFEQLDAYRKIEKEMKEEHKRSMEDSKQAIQQQKKKFQELLDSKVFAEVSEVKRQISNRLGAPADNVPVEIPCETLYSGPIEPVLSQLGTNFYVKSDAEKICRNWKRSYIEDNVSLYISFPIFRNATARRAFKAFKLEASADAIQADGRTLFEHLSPRMIEVNHLANIKIDVDNVESLILPFKIRDLVKISDNELIPLNGTAKAILAASELYNNKKHIEMAD